MSYEAWGDGGDQDDYGHLLDAGWWDADQTKAVTDAITALCKENFYEGGEKENGVSVAFIARLTLLRASAGLLDSNDPLVIDAMREIARRAA